MSKGFRNMIVLISGAIVIALATVSISLSIYYNSGDVFLDRSRPGYIPTNPDEYQSEAPKTDYKMSESGELTPADLKDYLDNINIENLDINSVSDPFSADVLSDFNLISD